MPIGINGQAHIRVIAVCLLLGSSAAQAQSPSEPEEQGSTLLKLLPLLTASEDPALSSGLVGSWYLDDGNRNLLTFIDETTYFVTQDVDNAGEPLCSDGMETGTYTWFSENGNFGYTNTIDTTGDCGLTSVQGGSGSATVAVNGNTMTVSDGEGSFQLQKVIDQNIPIVGSWYLEEPEGGRSIVTFLDGSNFLITQDVDEVGEPECSDGMESGTYTWNPADGDFQYANLIDTTGDCGLTSFQGESGGGTLTLDGDTLTFADEEDSVPLTAVR